MPEIAVYNRTNGKVNGNVAARDPLEKVWVKISNHRLSVPD
jgi:hypothetical protein